MDSFTQTLTENSYSRETELSFADCDCSQQMRLGAMLTKAAIYAGFDYDARCLPYDVLYENREVFLLSRLAMLIRRRPKVGDILNITTWENGVHGAHMQRVYRFATRSGEECITVKSDWILVDPVTRRILRPNTFTAKPITTCPIPLDCPEPKKLKLPGQPEPLGERTVRWSDLDGNGHLFSGYYGDIIWDALPRDLQEASPREFYINYNHEATLGDTLSLVGDREGSAYWVEGLGPKGACFTSLIQF